MDRVSDDPDTQVEQVIGMMANLVRADAGDPNVVSDAHRALADPAANGDPLEAVFHWVTARMQFVKDEETAAPLQPYYAEDIVEVLIRPRDMSDALRGQVGQGDCDDFTIYGAALLRALNVPVDFVTIAADSRDPNAYSHVYLAAYPAGRGRVALDLSHGPFVGWESRTAYRKREWALDGPFHGPLASAVWLGTMALAVMALTGKVN
jgi:transglutaminase-like putative cysteine protease